MGRLELELLASAARIRAAWPQVAPLLGCEVRLDEVETAAGALALMLDAGTGTDYFVTRRLSGARVPVASRTHEPKEGGARRYSGWTMRHGPGEREFSRLNRAIDEPFAMYPRVLIEGYFDPPSESLRVCVARTQDVVRWCRRWMATGTASDLLRQHILRINDEDDVTFFAPSVANLARDGAPAWQCDITTLGPMGLFGPREPRITIREENGAPEALWR